ncbi:MAG: anaerobic glycerol-3-phosphate dehydrogenase subunit B [Alphaproteobacteria bacterium]
MKSDALIVGAELDGLIAATRLLDHGHSVRMLSTGVGSLHYAPGGIHVLGYAPDGNGQPLSSPFDALSHLNENHPYQKIGVGKARAALDWFFGGAGPWAQCLRSDGNNASAVSPAGLDAPAYGVAWRQATFECLYGKQAAIVRVRHHRDFPAELLALELGKKGVDASIVDIDAPGLVVENAGLARAFDALEDSDIYFSGLKSQIPDGTEVVLFPAVLGLSEHSRILAALERALAIPCLEVPTLPPSIPGMRLQSAFEHALNDRGVIIHTGVHIERPCIAGGRFVSLVDDRGRSHDASVIVISTGGILMGGLDVDSHGAVHETTLGLDVYQSEPLNALSVDRSLSALHVAGVATDGDLRPLSDGSTAYENVFVTGRTLAHWNPAEESSAEGVSIATGWVAAEAAHAYLGATGDG